jgi:hypothetical protein
MVDDMDMAAFDGWLSQPRETWFDHWIWLQEAQDVRRLFDECERKLIARLGELSLEKIARMPFASAPPWERSSCAPPVSEGVAA